MHYGIPSPRLQEILYEQEQKKKNYNKTLHPKDQRNIRKH